MLFSRKQSLVAVLALGSLLSVGQTVRAVEDHVKAAVAASAVGLASLYVLKHKADATNKNKGLHVKALDAASHYGNKLVNWAWDNHRTLTAAAVAGLVAGVVVVHGRESHHINLVHQARHLFSKHHESKP